MNGYTLTKVFEINGKLIVGDSLEQAIATYRLWAPEVEIQEISQKYAGNYDKQYNAIVAEPEIASCNLKGWELTHITFTGVDDHTDFHRLVDIKKKYPKVEFGVLVSRKWFENGTRYLSPFKAKALRGLGLNLSAHLCGSMARDVLHMGGFANTDDFPEIIDIFSRVQLNVSKYDEPENMSPYIQPGPLQEIIIQQDFNHNTFMLCRIASGDCISILLDESGGKGIENPFRLPSYLHNVHVGFAGGINPDNVVAKIREITSLPSINRFWIDMESGVRTDDRFDLDKVEKVCQLVYDNFLTVRA